MMLKWKKNVWSPSVCGCKINLSVSNRRENNKLLFCGEKPEANLMINGALNLEIKGSTRVWHQFVLPSSCLAGWLIVRHFNPRGAVLGSHFRVDPWSESDLPNSQESPDVEKWGKSKNDEKCAKSWSLHDDCASSALLPKPDLTFTSSSTEIRSGDEFTKVRTFLVKILHLARQNSLNISPDIPSIRSPVKLSIFCTREDKASKACLFKHLSEGLFRGRWIGLTWRIQNAVKNPSLAPIVQTSQLKKRNVSIRSMSK